MVDQDIGRTTLVCTWFFTALATFSVVILALNIRHMRRSNLGDYLVFISFAIALVLVIQTTWAVLDEGQGAHESELGRSGDFAVVAKVRDTLSHSPFNIIRPLYTDQRRAYSPTNSSGASSTL